MRVYTAVVLALIFLAFETSVFPEDQSSGFSIWSVDNTTKKELLQPTEIQGISCRDWVVYYESGEMYRCVLAREDTVSGHPLPEGTIVFLTPSGQMLVSRLSQDTQIQGHLCMKARGHSYYMVFYPSGMLKVAWLAHNEMIQNVPCIKTSFWGDVFGGSSATYFHDNGKISRCKLAKNVTIEGSIFKKGDHINFDREGKLIGKK